jgi:hypothetical protein
MSEGELLLAALSGVLTLFCTAMGWWLISLHNRHEKLRADHEELRVRVAERYLQKDDMVQMMENLKGDIHQLLQSFKSEVMATIGARVR